MSASSPMTAFDTALEEIEIDARASAKDFNRRNGWDTEAAYLLAYQVLTDANCHAEASALLHEHTRQ